MSDRMLITDKNGRTRYLIDFYEEASITDVLNCEHEFNEDGLCFHCNLYPDEISLVEKEY